MGAYVAQNWFTLLSAAGVIATLLFTGISFRSEEKTRRVANLLILTQNHRELWAELFHSPKLRRVLDPSVDLSKKPITLNETIYVNMIIQHLNSAYATMENRLVIKADGVRRDVQQFFSLPIPKAVWAKMKSLNNPDFVDFVDRCCKGE